MAKIELFNVDCLDFLKQQPDNDFDLAIVDPPYGTSTHTIKNGRNRTHLAKAKDYKWYPNNKKDRPTPEYFDELKRVSKNQIVWGANHLCDLFNAAGNGWVVWEKEATANFSACELAYTSFNCALKRFRFVWSGMHQGEFGGDVRRNVIRIHPSQKPVQLYLWLLTNFAKPGQRVLDTHLGSGSSAIAAHMFGCDFVGCEIDPDYFAAATERFENETKQQSLFNAPACN